MQQVQVKALALAAQVLQHLNSMKSEAALRSADLMAIAVLLDLKKALEFIDYKVPWDKVFVLAFHPLCWHGSFPCIIPAFC